jgi:uncharacterized protein (UPF0335 family)
MEESDNKIAEVGGIAADRLRSYIERIESVEADMDELKQDRKEIYIEVGSAGFDKKIVRQIIKLRKQEEHVRRETEELLDLYRQALGML